MIKENENKNGVFRKIVAQGKIVGTISVEKKMMLTVKTRKLDTMCFPKNTGKVL